MIQQFRIQGMTCAACSNRVERGLNRLDSVEASVNFTNEKAHVTYDPKRVTFDQIRQHIESLGYEVVVDEVQLDIIGMTCAACSGRIERVLRKDPRIERATINLALETGTIRYNPEELTPEAIIQRIQQIGFDATLHAATTHHKEDDIRKRTKLFYISLLFTLPLVWTMWSHFSFTSFIYVPPILLNPYVQWALATPVQFGIGATFYKGAYYSLKNKSANMDVLVALGTSAAYFYSIYLVFAHPTEGLYFETSAMLITLILLGKVFEAKAKGRSSEAIQALIGMQPTKATVIREGEPVDIAIEEVKRGDHLLIRPGETIPVDATIIRGTTSIDESMLTGESMPVTKKIDDAIFAATMNTTGTIEARVTNVGRETMLSQIIRIVEEAQSSKAPIQRLADDISNIFVPVVVGIALVTFIVWYGFVTPLDMTSALTTTIAVLVIACPCALGLATPTSIMAGSGRAAELGILFKTAEAMERTNEVDTVVFDKTGTITEGTPAVTYFKTTMDEIDVLSAIVAAEQQSEHPLGRAIVTYGQTYPLHRLTVETFRAESGRGIRAVIDGVEWIIGNRASLHDDEIPLDERLRTDRQTLGETVMYVATDRRHVATIAVADRIKPNAPDVIRELHDANIRTVMLTGDNRETAEAIARQVGIDTVIADVLPTEKADVIRQLEREGEIVAMVGDGINDAPALAEASIGIAMSTGTDVAIEAADITVMHGDIALVPKALYVSERTVLNIRQNLFWALAYNSLGIPIAAFGLLAPWVAGAAMAFSSVSVVFNALRLQRMT